MPATKVMRAIHKRKDPSGAAAPAPLAARRLSAPAPPSPSSAPPESPLRNEQGVRRRCGSDPPGGPVGAVQLKLHHARAGEEADHG